MSNKNKKTDTFLKYLYKMGIGGVVGDPINPKTLDAADSAKNFLSKMIESPLFKERYAATKGKKIEDVSVEELTNYKNKVTDNINTAKHGDVFENGNDFANRSYRGWYDPTKTREEQETIKLGKQQFIDNSGGIDKINKVLDAESSIYKVSDKIPYSIGNIAYPMFSNVRSKYESFNIPENHKVYTQNNEYLPGIIDHEYSHASTRGNEDLNYKGVPFLMNEDVLSKPENSDYKNQKGYFQDPTEQKARVDATRKWMSENKSYNPFNERFDESHYNILKSKIDTNGEGIDHDLFKQMKDLILPYDKEETIRMFNTYTNVDNKNLGIQTAAYGGTIQNNMRKKMGLGGFAPLFDIASNLLLDGTMQAVTGMVKSIREPEPESRITKRNTGMVMAKGGIVDPSMYMQQMMYGSYGMGGQVPVEVEGGEQFEMPNGQQGQFQGPLHEQGGVPTELPQGTKVYSDRLKGENGKTMADRKEIRERNVAKLERLISKNPHDKLLKETLKRQQQVANSEEQGDMAMQEQANQKQQMQEQQMMQQQMMGQMMQNPEMMMALGGYVQKLAGGSPGTCPPGQYWNGTDCVDIPNSFASQSKFLNSADGKSMNTAFQKRDGVWKGITIGKGDQIPHEGFKDYNFTGEGNPFYRFGSSLKHNKDRILNFPEQINIAYDDLGVPVTDEKIISELNTTLNEPSYLTKNRSEAEYYEGLTAMQPLMQLFNPLTKNNNQNYSPFTSEQWSTITSGEPFELPVSENTEEQSFKGSMEGTGRFPKNKHGKFNTELNRNLDFMNDYFDQYGISKRGGTKSAYFDGDKYPVVKGFQANQDRDNFERELTNYGEYNFNAPTPDINNFDYGKGAVNKGLSTLGNKMKGLGQNKNIIPNVNNNLPLPPTYTEGQSKLNVPNVNVPIGNIEGGFNKNKINDWYDKADAIPKTDLTQNNTPFFSEEQLNQLGTPQFNPLDARKKYQAAPTINPNANNEIIDSDVFVPPVNNAPNLNWKLNNLPKLNANIQDVNETNPSGGINPLSKEALIQRGEEGFKDYKEKIRLDSERNDDVIREELMSKMFGPKPFNYNKNTPTSPLMMGVNPVTDMVQNYMNTPKTDPMAGKYPLNPQEPVPTDIGGGKKGGALQKIKNMLSGIGGNVGSKGEQKGGVNSSGDLTRGDIMGMAGTFLGGTAPMMNTMVNRMMTPKNQNFMREYGAEGLRAMQEAQGLATINRDKQLADIKLGEEAGRQRGRNSARGVNTLRAMDIASDMGANQAQNQAYNSYGNQMMQLLGQKAQMENQQDQMVMTGETARDLADRQDLDNYYTQLGTDLTTQSKALQEGGKNLNQEHYNQMVLSILPMLSRYGIGIKGDGKSGWEQYDVNPVKPEVAEVVQKPEEIKTIPTPKKALGGVVKKSNNKFTNKFNHIMNRK